MREKQVMEMYETQNKKIISHLAKSDLKSKKMGNLFIIITIVLAAGILMVMGLFPRSLNLENRRLLSGAQDVIYHEVTKEQIKALEQDDRISYMMLDKNGEEMEVDDYIIHQVYYEENSQDIKTLEAVEGKLPQKMNEVMVSREYVKKTGKEPELGMKIQIPSLSGKEEVCVVSGFSKALENSKIYPISRSKAYAERGKGMKDVDYDVLAKIGGSSDMSQEEFLYTVRDIGTKAGVPRKQVNENNYYVDTLYGGLFTQENLVIFIIGLIILSAAVMVIYSIFYISITGKTRDYGQLRTLGMTKKQVRSFVKREGLLLTLRGLPVGLILGGLISWAIKPMGFSLANTAVMALITAAIVLLTVLVSILKPASLAAAVSPIEAAKYSVYTGDTGKKSTKKLQRKLTPLTLARMNNSRNRKKSFITSVSLGLSGILFIGAVTFATSLDMEKYSRQGEYVYGEFVVGTSINAEEVAKNGFAEIQATSNPLTGELRQEIGKIPGVKKILEKQNATIRYDYEDVEAQEDTVTGFSEENMGEIKELLQEGTADYQQLLRGRQILIRGNDLAEEIFGWRFQVGDKVTLYYYDGKQEDVWKSRTYEIAGILDHYHDELTDGWFLLPQQVIEKELPQVNLAEDWILSTDEAQRDQIEETLSAVVSENAKLSMETLREHEEQDAKAMNLMKAVMMGIVLFITMFSMINLINTLISSFLSQKTELAMLQSIGMTGSQMRSLIMGEGALLAIGNIAVSLIFGSLLGYGICSMLYQMGMHYMLYQFPLLYSLLYVAVVLLVPCLISFIMLRRFKNQSLVDRLREV